VFFCVVGWEVWDRSELLYVLGVQVAGKVGRVLPIGEDEDLAARLITPVGVCTV
jgi:hypothetical protein